MTRATSSRTDGVPPTLTQVVTSVAVTPRTKKKPHTKNNAPRAGCLASPSSPSSTRSWSCATAPHDEAWRCVNEPSWLGDSAAVAGCAHASHHHHHDLDHDHDHGHGHDHVHSPLASPAGPTASVHPRWHPCRRGWCALYAVNHCGGWILLQWGGAGERARSCTVWTSFTASLLGPPVWASTTRLRCCAFKSLGERVFSDARESRCWRGECRSRRV